ncbi:MAG: 6-phospho-beta-glucosidase [Clostridia bacterium]|nr:6-phospho-beta-glucosidase [Clostridia bacterium]
MKTFKFAIIGAGSTYTPELIEGLINMRESIPLRELVLMDIDAEKLHIVGGLAERMIRHAGLDCRFLLTQQRDDALDGADIVFVQIRVGKLPARILDEKIPLKHGLIGQETTGIGGFFKALRTVPVLADIMGRMTELCPDAFMINFSNPSGICAQALYDMGYTRMMGLCNAPIAMLTDPAEALGLDLTKTESDYVGLNHFSFITSIRSGGVDYLKEAVSGDDRLLEKLSGQQGFDKEIIRLAGAIPNGYLQYYYFTRERFNYMQSAKETRGEICVQIERDLLQMYADEGLYEKPTLLSKRGGARYSEVALSLADAIANDRKQTHVVNVPNRGAFPFMEDGDVMELKAVVGKDGAVPIPMGEAGNRHIRSLLRSVKAYERYAAQAALTGDRDLALNALMCHPLTMDMPSARACFDEMLEAHRPYLERFFR